MDPRVLSPEELAAVRERARKASPGPWAWPDTSLVDLSSASREDESWDGEEAEFIYFDGLRGAAETILWGIGLTDYSGEIGVHCEADAQFIAHAREDIPNLLRTIDALQQEAHGGGGGAGMPACKRCGSETVVKFGTRKGRQRYLCESCHGTFTDNGAAAGMRIREEVVQAAVELAGRGLSLREVQRELEMRYGFMPSLSTIHKWRRRSGDA